MIAATDFADCARKAALEDAAGFKFDGDQCILHPQLKASVCRCRFASWLPSKTYLKQEYIVSGPIDPLVDDPRKLNIIALHAYQEIKISTNFVHDFPDPNLDPSSNLRLPPAPGKSTVEKTEGIAFVFVQAATDFDYCMTADPCGFIVQEPIERIAPAPIILR
ncbi:uncharacterized protein LOC108682736 [Hyalella azteca]|uniref:Uncharacterized protein LOC108682736 n=1 Tax=Hyalella azteca TaxID=294128 RepID=A0A8B7PQA9_HYAAZ|nr:uncharacterized protein LOC108682736 [Hyalella azteca]